MMSNIGHITLLNTTFKLYKLDKFKVSDYGKSSEDIYTSLHNKSSSLTFSETIFIAAYEVYHDETLEMGNTTEKQAYERAKEILTLQII